MRDYFEVIGPDARVLLGERRTDVFGDIPVNTDNYQFSVTRDVKKTLVSARYSFLYMYLPRPAHRDRRSALFRRPNTLLAQAQSYKL